MPGTLRVAVTDGTGRPLPNVLIEARLAPRPRFNVRDYGAGRNDITGDTLALQRVIDIAPPGSDIYFPAGTYWSDGVFVRYKAGLRFIGDGPFVSILRRPPHAGNTRIMTVEGGSDFTFTALGFDENGIERFGGVNLYAVRHVLIENTWHFDSSPRPIPQSDWTDLYAWVFGNGGVPSEDIVLRNNVVDDLQVEIDMVRRVTIVGNQVSRSRSTAGIGFFSLSDDAIIEDVLVEGNTITDARSGGAGGAGVGIAVHMDPPWTNGGSFRRIAIRRNTIIRRTTNGNGIQVGTPNNSVSSAGNVFEDIVVEGNRLHVASSAPRIPEDRAGIKFNNSETANIRMARMVIRANVMTGVGYAMDLRSLEDSLVEENDSRRGGSLLACTAFRNSRILNNLIEAGPGVIPYYWGRSLGGNIVQSNRYIEPAEQPITIDGQHWTDTIEIPTFEPNPPAWIGAIA